MNEFSIVCRILGSLFSRSPDDAVLDPLFGLLSEGKLKQHWPLEQDELLERMGSDVNRQTLAEDYFSMFGTDGSVSPLASGYEGPGEEETRAFLTERGVPLSSAPANGFGQLLLAAYGLKIIRLMLTKLRHSWRYLTTTFFMVRALFRPSGIPCNNGVLPHFGDSDP